MITKILKAVTLMVLIFVVLTIYVSRNLTETRFQKNTLIRIQSLPVDKVASVLLKSRGEKKEMILVMSDDRAKITKLLTTIRQDLWVSESEVNPNENEPPPIYDLIKINIINGESIDLNCWMGKEGGVNPSLTIRSKKDNFKKVAQEILNGG